MNEIEILKIIRELFEDGIFENKIIIIIIIINEKIGIWKLKIKFENQNFEELFKDEVLKINE